VSRALGSKEGQIRFLDEGHEEFTEAARIIASISPADEA